MLCGEAQYTHSTTKVTPINPYAWGRHTLSTRLYSAKDHFNWVEFLAELVVLKSKGIDVIFGMDWLSQQDGHIGCAEKVLHLTNSDGVQVICQTRGSGPDPMVFRMEAKTLEEVRVVGEY